MSQQRLRFSLEINGTTVVTETNYADFLRRLRDRLGVRHSHNIPALAVEANPPPGFCDLIIEVVDEDNPASVRFRLRVDNLYLVGYQMQGGEWLEFDSAGTLIDGSEPLGFNCNYRSMARAAGEGLSSVSIGLNVLGSTIRTLATSTKRNERARSLIVVIFMFCEAARFIPVSDYISGHREGFGIPEWMRDLVCSWGVLSGALLRADAYPDEPFMLSNGDVIRNLPGNREIRTLADVILALGILLGLCFTRPRKFLSLVALNNEQPQCFVGLPLLDVFPVEIHGISTSDDPRIFGTITIGNGMSPRYVYILTKDNSEYVGSYIEPSGPPEAIAAYTEILIDVKLLLTYERELRRVDDDETEAVGGNINETTTTIDVFSSLGPAKKLVDEIVTWDAFNLGSPYDRVIAAPLTSTVGSFTINYAVWRNAVAATVFVTLREAYEGTSEVYGTIHAFNDGWPRARSVLFHRTSGDYASVERGHNIPLLKSFVAVPLGQNPLRIHANLTEYDPIADDPIVDQTLDFPIPDSLPASSFKDSTITDGNQIRVTVSWSSGYIY